MGAILTKTDRKNQRNIELCRRIKNGDHNAENRILIENEGLIFQISGTLTEQRRLNSSDGIDEEDLIQEGRIAMLTAAYIYDESKNVRFATFAYEIIRNAMIDLCDHCQSSFERHMEATGRAHLFLDDDETTEKALYGKIDNSRIDDPTGNQAILNVTIEKMLKRLAELPERQRKVLIHRYGLETFIPKSIPETAAYFHLSEKNLRATEKKALLMLRKLMDDGKVV